MTDSRKPKDPFARVSTFARLKKLETSKTGRQLVITDFSLAGNQFDEIDDLASNQTEVMVTIQPSRRGTVYAGQDVQYRLTAENYSYEQDAFSELVIETSNAMRSRMLEKFADGVRGWDDEANVDEIRDKIKKCIREADWVDALNNIMILRNLFKPIPEVDEFEEAGAKVEEESSLFGEEAEEEEEVETVPAKKRKK